MAEAAADDEVVIEEVGPSTEDKELSAMKASQEKAKEFSYYYAHAAGKQELPADAVVREEDPLVRADGCGPHKIQAESPGADEENVRWINDYSYGDEGALVKLYVEFPETVSKEEVQCSFDRFSVDMRVRKAGGTTYGVRIKEHDDWVLEHERKNGFYKEIVPEKCKFRVSSSGQRITLTLAKLDEKEGWSELKKKDIRADLRKK